jgi:hypothetical protein
MGLQLEGYGSDSDSEVSGSQASPKATDIVGQQDSVGPVPGLPIQTKRKAPVKIGLNHPILGKVDEELSLRTESEDIVSVPTKRSRAASQVLAGGGRSGLLDLLPPPKKRVQTKQNGGSTRKDVYLLAGSGQAKDDVAKPFGDVPTEKSPAFTTARLAEPKTGSAGPSSDLFGLGKPSPIHAQTFADHETFCRPYRNRYFFAKTHSARVRPPSPFCPRDRKCHHAPSEHTTKSDDE